MKIKDNNTMTDAARLDDCDSNPDCKQRDTIQRIFGLWKETNKQQINFQRELVKRDETIKRAFDDVQDKIKWLISELEKREYINNYNKREKEILENRIDGQQEIDVDLYSQVAELRAEQAKMQKDIAVIKTSVTLDDKNKDRKWSFEEKVIIAVIGGIVAPLLLLAIIFMVKLIIWG